MKWDNLKSSKCPKCRKPLLERGDFFQCTDFKEPCDFIISKTKFEHIVNKLYQPRRHGSDDEAQQERDSWGADGRTVHDPDEPPRQW